MFNIKHYLIHILGRVLFQERVDGDGRAVQANAMTRFNRSLIERGVTPPWVFSQKECVEFWQRITNAPQFTGNQPKQYATKDTAILNVFHNFMLPEITPSDSIMELGCNCGANLRHFWLSGYRNLYGVEINPNAITQMARSFPDMKATVWQSTIERMLQQIPTGKMDVVFTMGVSEHIHPDSHFIFGEMARVARRYVVTLEGEVGGCAYVFPRNYRRVFEKLGCPQIKSASISKDSFPCVSRDYDGHVMRMFRVTK